MKLCAHLGYQFTEYQGLQRLEQAARAGFDAVEWPAVYDFDKDELAAASRAFGLKWVQITLPTGERKKGEKGVAALAGRRDEFLRGLDTAVSYAKDLGARLIHPMAGVGVCLTDDSCMRVYLQNLASALEVASAHGMRVLIEVISEVAVPGYAMHSYDLASQVCGRLPEIQLLIDTYHAQILTGNPTALVEQWAGHIGHVQVADEPGRHEPGTGRIDFAAFFAALKKVGYDGWVGCEYQPLRQTQDGLFHLDKLRPLL